MTLLLDHLQSMFPDARRTTLRRMVSAGRVRVDQMKARSTKMVVREGASVEVADRAIIPLRPVAGRSDVEIIFEDAHLLVVTKPPGLLTSTTPREKRPTLLKWVMRYLQQTDRQARVGLVHRLDRDAGGLLVFAKTELAYDSLKSQFYHHSVERVYLAAVEGRLHPAAGRIDMRLLELPDGRVVQTRHSGRGNRAVSDYQTLEVRDDQSLVQITLKTGRKHQIRAHLAERRCPIVGDAMYGAVSADQPLHLTAVRLGLIHPASAEPMLWEILPTFAW